jgi:hypothetical protein
MRGNGKIAATVIATTQSADTGHLAEAIHPIGAIDIVMLSPVIESIVPSQAPDLLYRNVAETLGHVICGPGKIGREADWPMGRHHDKQAS